MRIYFLRVIPTVKHYPDIAIIASDIPSGSMYGILILTFYLTFYQTYFLAYLLTFFLAFHLYLRRFFVVEVRLGTLRSSACSRGGGGGGGTADIKSSNPHLTGGENGIQHDYTYYHLVMTNIAMERSTILNR